MKVQLEKEGDADEEIYSNMACWCSTNDKGKSKAVADVIPRGNTYREYLPINIYYYIYIYIFIIYAYYY